MRIDPFFFSSSHHFCCRVVVLLVLTYLQNYIMAKEVIVTDTGNTASPSSSNNNTQPSSTQTKQLISINAASQLPLKLTSTNYYSWKVQFDALLYGFDLLGYIDGSNPCPEPFKGDGTNATPNLDYAFWTRQDKLLFLAIIASLSPTIVPVVRTCTTSA